MNYKDINRILSGKINSANIVEIYRSSIDEVSMLGQAVAISSKLLMLTNTYDFFTDGYRIIRCCDITDVVTAEKNNNLKFMNMIYRKEGLFADHSNKIINDVKSWAVIFSKLISDKIPVTVECNFEDAIDYYVGWIKELNQNIAVMQCFDGEGKLFKNSVSVNLDYVSAVTFADRYTSTMAKYIYKE